jgi:hypothetical protein
MEVTSSIEGARVENNKFCVSVHYRNVAEKVRLRATETFILYYVYLFIFPFLFLSVEKWMKLRLQTSSYFY